MKLLITIVSLILSASVSQAGGGAAGSCADSVGDNLETEMAARFAQAATDSFHNYVGARLTCVRVGGRQLVRETLEVTPVLAGFQSLKLIQRYLPTRTCPDTSGIINPGPSEIFNIQDYVLRSSANQIYIQRKFGSAVVAHLSCTVER